MSVAKKERLYAAFHLAIGTGIRQGEILGLRWKDVDLDKGILYIRQTLSHDGKEFLVGAKTASGVRSVKLASETIAVLKKHRSMIIREKLQQGSDYMDLDLVICTTKGTQVIASNLRKTYDRLIEAANVPKIRIHDLRHTHATYLFSKGIHAKVISESLGHSNIKITYLLTCVA